MTKTTTKLSIDPAHAGMEIFGQDITKDVWSEKYRSGDELDPMASFARICDGVYKNDTLEHKDQALIAMKLGLWMPAGRIQAGAGTKKHVTLMNCYVNSTLDDSMEGIFKGLTHNALTLRMGGGMGTDFSPLRPEFGRLGRLGDGVYASGPISFMNVWDASCTTIMSAGYRRGAMMGTLIDSHPDLPRFLRAKTAKGTLTQFNISILISDAFMDAVRHGEDWDLYFKEPPTNKDAIGTFEDDDGTKQYIYERWDARELWDLIIRTTYEFSEPGVIFIDRINDMNNLQYCEDIHCTNPCGEQPLPPHGCCLLGAINLARLVLNPFRVEGSLGNGEGPKFDFDTLKAVVHIGVRFMDNVIDITKYPLPEQKAEELAKRRIGLGISGLADAMAQLGVRYGSTDSEAFTRRVMRTIAIEAYTASAELAKERGSFPLYDAEKFTARPFIKKLPAGVQGLIAANGLRNGVLLTIAPTGTTSLLYGDISSGLEPVFRYRGKRNVLQGDGSRKAYDTENYGYRLYQSIHGTCAPHELPDHMVSTDKLSVSDHIRIQAAAQEWVDASVSKTINCPEDLGFEEFMDVYNLAYDLGCKGCTTYRPSSIRGSVLEDADTTTPVDGNGMGTVKPVIPKRPDILIGKTYKISWPSLPSALYLTINRNEDDGSYPYEVFINSRSSQNAEWMTALTLMISAIMRTTNDIEFIAEELQQVVSAHDSAWLDGKYYGSLVARIGKILHDHFTTEGILVTDDKPQEPDPIYASDIIPTDMIASGSAATLGADDKTTIMSVGVGVVQPSGSGSRVVSTVEVCPACGAPTLIHQEGCTTCTQCGYSNCG